MILGFLGGSGPKTFPSPSTIPLPIPHTSNSPLTSYMHSFFPDHSTAANLINYPGFRAQEGVAK